MLLLSSTHLHVSCKYLEDVGTCLVVGNGTYRAPSPIILSACPSAYANWPLANTNAGHSANFCIGSCLKICRQNYVGHTEGLCIAGSNKNNMCCDNFTEAKSNLTEAI